MGENSKIGWTDHTFNPWWGCTKVSEGCEHCYAEQQAKRWGYDCFGLFKDRRGMKRNYWLEPMGWHQKAARAGQRAKVFCGSMCDLFEDIQGQIRFADGTNSPVEPVRRMAFDVMESTDWLDWLLCTKRPENVMWAVKEHWRERFPSNVWMLATAENQQRLEERAGKLLEVPAVVRGLSVEPMLSEMDLTDYIWPTCRASKEEHDTEHAHGMFCNDNTWVDWVIVGAESGDRRRPCPLWWVESVVDQCAAAGVACFVKQLDLGGHLSKDPAEWPERLRVQQFPEVKR